MKIHRLKGRDRIQELFTYGKVVSSFPLHARYLQKKEEGICRLGVSVPKKNLPRAVDRNRVKRQLWALVQKNNVLFYNLIKENKTSVMLVYCNKTVIKNNLLEKHLIDLLKHWKEKN
ncbi:MAG: ribonuclease P protein component [Flavobacteriaceae bacterium]